MICHQRQLIFFHPNRCGGKSIEKILWGIKPLNKSSDHNTISMMVKQNNEDILSYFKFMFCRNPWDKLVSVYFSYKQSPYKQTTPGRILQNIDFENAVIKNLIPTRLQIEYIRYKGKIYCDFIGRFEKYEKDFNKLCKSRNWNISLPHINKSKHRNYKEYYNEELIQIVAKRYAEDIDYFKYTFD